MLTYHVTLDDGETISSPQPPTWLGALSHRIHRQGWTFTKEYTAMTVYLTPNDRGNPPGKLADAELHFNEGPLEGLKLIGFSIWEVTRGGTRRNVTFPARQYTVNGERRSFALLRPIVDTSAQGKIRELILEAYAEWEAQIALINRT